MKKNVFRTVFMGMGIGLSIFALTGIIFNILYQGEFVLHDWSYTKMAVGSMAVGIGFSLPSMVYRSRHLPFAMKILIHMGIGCTVMLVTAAYVGWIPFESGWKISLFSILCEVVIAFLIWLGFSRHYKKLAVQMNEKIKEKNSKDNT